MTASSVRVPLNNETFFKYFVCKAFSKASKELLNAKDLLKARIAAIAFGIFTLGIGIGVCRCYYYDRRTITPSNLLKMQKNHITKKFSGSEENKIKLLNSFCDESFKQQYGVLKTIEMEGNIADLCMRNKDKIKSRLLPSICAFEVLELLKNDSKSRDDKIAALESGLLRRYHMKTYRKILIDSLLDDSSVKVVEKILRSTLQDQEEYFDALYCACMRENPSGFDYSKFRSVYSTIKEISSKEEIPNYLLHKVQDSKGANLNKKIRILAFATEILSCIESHKANSEPLFLLINLAVEALGPINYNEQESLRNLLYPTVPHRKINMIISFLIVEKGSQLHANKKEKKEEIAKTILQQGCIKKFESEDKIIERKENLEKLNKAIKELFKNVGELELEGLPSLIRNVGLLRKKINDEFNLGSFCFIDLKGMRLEDKVNLFKYLSQEGANLKEITFQKPGRLQFDLKINKF